MMLFVHVGVVQPLPMLATNMSGSKSNANMCDGDDDGDDDSDMFSLLPSR